MLLMLLLVLLLLLQLRLLGSSRRGHDDVARSRDSLMLQLRELLLMLLLGS